MEGAAVAVCFPLSTRARSRRAWPSPCATACPFVARGSGTGLAGGAVPPEGAVVISTTKMNRILSVDPAARRAWVEPGVLNLDLTRAVAEHGLHFAPDPSSQQTCSIGGNVANNSGGPHCLAEGVTNAHILALEVVLPDGSVAVLGGEDPEPLGYDLRGVFVGSEGMFGIATKVCVRLTPDPPAVCTMLMDFGSVEDGASTVSAVIAAGVVPAAMEMMDQLCLQAVEAYIHAGLPVESAAALLVEVVGLPHGVDADTELITRIAAEHGVRHGPHRRRRRRAGAAVEGPQVGVRRDRPDQAELLPPRHRRAPGPAARRAGGQVYEIAARHDLLVLNVFHAGDGNLHPLLVYDGREPGVMERVHAAGEEIVRVSVAAGGVLSGEHGIGLEKRDLMPLMFSAVDLAAQAALRAAFDPRGLANPGKVLPSPAGCGDVQVAKAVAEGAWI